MISLKRTNQGGSVLTFIIIATVLAGAVIGTAYFVKQRGEQVRQGQAIAQADKLSKDAEAKKATKTDNSPKSNDGATSSNPTVVSTESSPSVVPGAQAALPTTGAGSDSIRLLAIGLLVASSAGYIASRRVLGRSL